MRYSAFTLVELIITIAIVAILAGLLVPAVGMVRESGWSTRCLSNIKAVTGACLVYANDNSGYLPSIKLAASVGDNWQWFQQASEYVDGSRGSTAAKTTVAKAEKDCPKWRNAVSVSTARPGYGYNAYLLRDITEQPTESTAAGNINGTHNNWYDAIPWSGTVRDFRTAKITYASQRFLIGDSNDWAAGVYSPSKIGAGVANTITTAPMSLTVNDWDGQRDTTYLCAKIRPSTANASEQAFMKVNQWFINSDPIRHRSTSSVGFVDGHAASVRGEKLFLTIWNPRRF